LAAVAEKDVLIVHKCNL